MTTLSRDTIQHIARLARLRLSDDETNRMATELSSILSFVEQLNEVNTDGVEPTAQVTGLTTVLRPDAVDHTGPKPDLLLSCSPLPIVDHHIAAPHAHG